MTCHISTGGLGDLAYPLVSDLKKEISEAYGVLTDDGVALRGLFIIDPDGIVQHATINNLAFGRNVEETLRILQVWMMNLVTPCGPVFNTTRRSYTDRTFHTGWRTGPLTDAFAAGCHQQMCHGNSTHSLLKHKSSCP